jgi:hypothetical protein
MLELIVTVQSLIAPGTGAHPVQEEKAFPLGPGAGAVSVTVVPELYVSINGVLPLAVPLLSAGDAVIETPLAGLAESTVSVYVLCVVPFPPPHAVISTQIRLAAAVAIPTRTLAILKVVRLLISRLPHRRNHRPTASGFASLPRRIEISA